MFSTNVGIKNAKVDLIGKDPQNVCDTPLSEKAVCKLVCGERLGLLQLPSQSSLGWAASTADTVLEAGSSRPR